MDSVIGIIITCWGHAEINLKYSTTIDYWLELLDHDRSVLATSGSPIHRLNMDEDLLTVDMLPAPRKVIPKTEEVKLEPVQIPSKNDGVAMGDQIAIRSYVLGKSL